MTNTGSHVQHGEIDRFLQNELDAASADAIRSHVHGCKSCEENLVSRLIARLEAVSSDQGPHDRLEPRFQSHEFGHLQTISPLSFESVPIQLLDVSTNGFCLSSPAVIQPGTMVLVRAGGASKVGEVRHCQSAGDGSFHIGVSITKPTPKRFRTAKLVIGTKYL